MTEQIQNTLSLITNSGLNAIATQCYNQAVAQGKYSDGWDVLDGYFQIMGEAKAWYDAKPYGDEAQVRKYADLLHAVLSLGAHMCYDIELALGDAIRRNAKRVGEGEQAAGTKPDAATVGMVEG